MHQNTKIIQYKMENTEKTLAPVRVRFAPSPTGGLHIGGVRTALYNYILAKQTGGTFIIRIEDTDQTRFVADAEKYIYEALRWVGIEADESPEKGGPHAPYRQSERKPMYKQYVLDLVEKGHAYYAFDTTDELTEMRAKLEAAKAKNMSYNAISRMNMKNSITLPEDEVKRRLDAGEEYVIRFKMPHKEEVRFQDTIRGWVMVHSSTLDDKVLMKSDGMPTYHLANVVDDHLMEITHVIRGEEWLPSAPLHILLYQSFGWTAPIFAHLPLIMKPDLKDEKGKVIEVRTGKLSKRDGDEAGFPVFPLNWNGTKGFKENGYLPEAMINFLALLGWSAGDNREFFNIDDLIASFKLERINKAGAKFDIAKAKWFNQHYLAQKTETELLDYLKNDLKENNFDYSAFSDEKLNKICVLVKERAVFPQDLYKEVMLIFNEPTTYDEKLVASKWTTDASFLISWLKNTIKFSDEPFSGVLVKELLHQQADAKGIKVGQIMPALRVALTGAGAGPDLGTTIDVLGKDVFIKRLEKALEILK